MSRPALRACRMLVDDQWDDTAQTTSPRSCGARPALGTPRGGDWKRRMLIFRLSVEEARGFVGDTEVAREMTEEHVLS